MMRTRASPCSEAREDIARELVEHRLSGSTTQKYSLGDQAPGADTTWLSLVVSRAARFPLTAVEVCKLAPLGLKYRHLKPVLDDLSHFSMKIMGIVGHDSFSVLIEMRDKSH